MNCPYYKIGSKFISKLDGCVYIVVDNVSEDRFNIRKKQCVIGREDSNPEALGYGFKVENIIPFKELEATELEKYKLLKALKHLVIIAQKDKINKDHLDQALRKARNVIADIDPTVEKCDCCY
jgi:hypothetical protein